ncbi:MAG: NADH-quinone oxidoreductase subunit I [Acidilobaceae archaeon]
MIKVRRLNRDRQSFLKSIASSISVLILGLKYLFFSSRFTILYPEERPVHSFGFRGYVLLELTKCIGCKSCERICPASAIEMMSVAVDERRVRLAPRINYQRCIFCGLCVDVCPVEALSHANRLDQVYEGLEEMVVNPGDSPLRLSEEGEPSVLVVDEKTGLVKVRAKWRQ